MLSRLQAIQENSGIYTFSCHHPFTSIKDNCSIECFVQNTRALGSTIPRNICIIGPCTVLFHFHMYHFLIVIVILLTLQIREFCLYAHAAKPSKETPRIEECIQLFNGLTLWVVCNILREFTIVKRADIIEKFIDTTKVSLSISV